MTSGVVAVEAGWQPPSWDELVHEHSRRVYRWAYRLTGDPHDAEDLTQEVFVRVFRSLSSYSPGSFEGWLHRITTNLFLDGVRRRSRQRTVPLLDDDVAQLRDRGSDPAQRHADAVLDPDVQAALDALPEDFRRVVLLADVEGLSYEEISDVVGIKMGTVRSRLHRGRRQMRDSLEHRRPVREGGDPSPTLGTDAALEPLRGHR
jgi:RNA polymerase sigma-70 factor (ECF subfamily)